MTAPAVTGYCAVTDLLTGNIPTPSYLSPERFVNDAADEIDSRIGFVYVTRVDVSSNSPVVKPAKLLLKRLNVFLATGRMLMAVDAGGEDDQLHAYALSLVQEANECIEYIVSGQIRLDGAPLVEGEAPTERGPMISNLDKESNVEAFYDRIANPNYRFPGALGESERSVIPRHTGIVR